MVTAVSVIAIHSARRYDPLLKYTQGGRFGVIVANWSSGTSVIVQNIFFTKYMIILLIYVAVTDDVTNLPTRWEYSFSA